MLPMSLAMCYPCPCAKQALRAHAVTCVRLHLWQGGVARELLSMPLPRPYRVVIRLADAAPRGLESPPLYLDRVGG